MQAINRVRRFPTEYCEVIHVEPIQGKAFMQKTEGAVQSLAVLVHIVVI